MIKQGYKPTEIGVIPEDWEVVKIEECSDVKTGPFGSALHEKDYVLDGIPIITVEHLGERGILNANYPRVGCDDYYRLSNYKLLAGDIVFSRVGSIDRNSLIRYKEEGWLFSGRLLRLRIKNNNSSQFISYIFQTNEFKNRVVSVAVGQTMPSLNTKILNELKIPLPPLAEQEAIASALSDADAWIERLEQLIAKKRLIKQGAMQTLLTPQEDWEVMKLGEVCEFLKGKDLPKSDLSSNGKYECIHYGELFTNYRESINYVKSYTNNNLNKILSKSNDVLMPTSDVTPRGLATASCIKKDGVILGGDILIIRFQEGFDGVYFSYFISNNREEVLKYVSGSTVYHLYGSELSNLIFSFPSLSEQERIATILSDMDAELEALETQLAKARQIKQGMMQELLTGRVRLV